ncbi:MAG: diaminopimelate decarboxylase [Thermocladium sp.]
MECDINGINARDLVEAYGTPLLVYDLDRVRDNYLRLRNALGARINYAVKANGNLAILTLLRGLGAGVDASSPGEIMLARMAGYAGGDIMFTGNFLSNDDITYGIKSGVVFNFDSLNAFRRAINLGYRPGLVFFRLDVGYGRGETKGVTLSGEESKFGMFMEDAIKAYQAAAEAGAREFGIHMMMGSNVLDADYFIRIGIMLREQADEIMRRTGVEIRYYDVGGGFGIPYKPGEAPLDLGRLGELRRLFGDGLIIEPGRYLVGDAGYLLLRVTEVKRKGSRIYVGVDAGMNVLIRPALYGSYHEVISCGEGELTRVDVTGPICENTDRIAVERELRLPREGDLLIVLNAGAYVYSMSSNYNARPRPAEVVISGGRHALARRREELEELARGSIVPDIVGNA